MTRISYIVCDHGLGHLRRACLVACELKTLGLSVTIYSPISNFQRLLRANPQFRDISCIPFHTNTSKQSIGGYQSPSAFLLSRLSCLPLADIVVSDNLPDVLYLRPDAVILAHFFWHDIFKLRTFFNGYLFSCDHILTLHRPTIIGSGLFAMPYVKRQAGFKHVGLFTDFNTEYARESYEKSLLITAGTTPMLRKTLLSVACFIIRSKPISLFKLYLDPDIYTTGMPTWVVAADYTISMFSRISIAICRPGLGIVSELLARRIYILALHELDNAEMYYNSVVLEQVGAGQRIPYPFDFEYIIELVYQRLSDKTVLSSDCASLSFDGARETAHLIASMTKTSY